MYCSTHDKGLRNKLEQIQNLYNIQKLMSYPTFIFLPKNWETTVNEIAVYVPYNLEFWINNWFIQISKKKTLYLGEVKTSRSAP